MKKILLLIIMETWILFSCQMMPSWQMISNYELVKNTDSIVLAKAKKVIASNDKFGRTKIEFRTIKVIKGNFSKKSFSLNGNFDYEGASKSDDFSKARDGAFIGSCQAYDYKKDTTFLLFLDTKGSLVPYAFSRINEEVNNTISPWVRAVSFYVTTSHLNDYEKEKQKLKEVLRQDITIVGLKKDIKKHFNLPNSNKSEKDLRQLYKKFDDESIKSEVLWALVNKKENVGQDTFDELLSTDKWFNYKQVVLAYLLKIDAKDKIDFLVEAHKNKLNKEMDYDGAYTILGVIGALASKEHEPIIYEFCREDPKRMIHTFSNWIIRYPSKKFLKLARELNKDDDYVTFFLAKIGDREVVDWAKRYMLKDVEARYEAYYIIALSPLAESDRLAEQIIDGKYFEIEDIVSLVEGYGESTSPHKLKRLRQIKEKYQANDKIQYWVEVYLDD